MSGKNANGIRWLIWQNDIISILMLKLKAMERRINNVGFSLLSSEKAWSI